jgi:hypothetical protein
MMRSTDRVARVIVFLALSPGLAACSTAPSPSPTPPPASSPAPSNGSSASLAPPRTPQPTVPAGGLADWRRLPLQRGLSDAGLESVIDVGDRFLGVGCVKSEEGCGQPAIWESNDGLEWRTAGPVFLPPDATSGLVQAVASSRIGTVAAGRVALGDRLQASIWVRDAAGWVQVTPQSASDATVAALLATDGRVIAVGSGAFMELSGFKAWWSGDGTTWEAAPPLNAEGYPIALVPLQDAVLAWGPSCGVCVATTAWWLTVDGTAWQQVDPPRGLAGANITAIARTQGGYEAFGTLGGGDLPIRSAAWVADETATAWRAVDPPPVPDAASLKYQIPVGQGAVAAGAGPPGPGGEQQTGLVWLRGPGETTWRQPVSIPDLDVLALIQDPEQLNRIIVIGRTFEGLQERTVIWTGLVDWAA